MILGINHCVTHIYYYYNNNNRTQLKLCFDNQHNTLGVCVVVVGKSKQTNNIIKYTTNKDNITGKSRYHYHSKEKDIVTGKSRLCINNIIKQDLSNNNN